MGPERSQGKQDAEVRLDCREEGQPVKMASWEMEGVVQRPARGRVSLDHRLSGERV